MYDLSDEATGLSPMESVRPEESILTLQWQLGMDGSVNLNGEDVPVKYFSVRGIQVDENGDSFFTQVHIALPPTVFRPMLEIWQRVAEVDDAPPASHDRG